MAPPRPRRMRAATSPMPAASISSIGWNTSLNCGTPKSNSPWNVERPVMTAPKSSGSWKRASRIGLSERGAGLVLAALPSRCRIRAPTTENAAPPNSSRCVGPQSVTSWPKMRCQMSSSGNASREIEPQTVMITPPSGAHQPLGRRIADRLGFSSGSAIATTPAKRTPKRPTRMK